MDPFIIPSHIKAIIFDLEVLPLDGQGLTSESLNYLAQCQAQEIAIGLLTNQSAFACRKLIQQLKAEKLRVSFLLNAKKPLPFCVNKLVACLGVPKNKTLYVRCFSINSGLMGMLSGIQQYRLPSPKSNGTLFFQELKELMRCLLLRRSYTLIVPPSLTVPETIKPLLFLINPDSSQTRLEELQLKIKKETQRYGLPACIEVIRNVRKLHQHFALDITLGKYSAVVACGGDGTVRSVITLVAQNNPTLPIGIIPTGTGNLLAKALMIPHDVDAAITSVCQSNPMPISITTVNKHYATLVVGIGIDAKLVNASTTQLKKCFGPLAYLLGAIHVVLPRPKATYWLNLDGQCIERQLDGVMLIQRNQFIRAYSQNTHTRLESDDLLDVCLIKAVQPIDLWKIATALLNATYEDTAAIEYYQAKEVTVRTKPVEKIQIDGDIISDRAIKARVLREFIQILMPISVRK